MAHGPTPSLWKLTPTQMRELRRLYKSGHVGLRDLATQYGVGYSTIHNIVSGHHPGVSGGNLCRSQGKRPNRKAQQ